MLPSLLAVSIALYAPLSERVAPTLVAGKWFCKAYQKEYGKDRLWLKRCVTDKTRPGDWRRI